MGSVFRTPKPSAPVVVAPPPADTSQEEERQRRLEEMARRRRGRLSTIATSARGVTDPLAPLGGKNLLGE
ncbi:hypothetical protein [Telmatospirillum sp. J64-1]|uniref:hypothetical protein n=1 Tax=Telmatospirillum sp. J64-1 TaxID=2502183 RepID=UPI00115C7143|nr:hypothetical protein [Telmatospirillum sp. J64-1]